MLAVLEFSNCATLAVIVMGVAGASLAAASIFNPSDVARLRRLEEKVDMILQVLGLEYREPATVGGLSEEVRALADDPAQKIQAIKLHREQTGLGLKEAKDAVEAYIVSRQ